MKKKYKEPRQNLGPASFIKQQEEKKTRLASPTLHMHAFPIPSIKQTTKESKVGFPYTCMLFKFYSSSKQNKEKK